MANIGCRIYTKINRPDPALVKRFEGIPVANLDDCMNRIAALDSSLIPINDSHMVGTAFTVRCSEGDNLMFLKALKMVQPGDVLIIQAAGGMNRALCGEIMSTEARAAGVRGFVVDGCIRDRETLRTYTDFAVYAKGVIPNGPYKNGPGEINVPVAMCGQVIHPGDIIVGDLDGIVVIKPEEAEELLEKVEKIKEIESGWQEILKSGKEIEKPWIDEKLKVLGCEFF